MAELNGRQLKDTSERNEPDLSDEDQHLLDTSLEAAKKRIAERFSHGRRR